MNTFAYVSGQKVTIGDSVCFKSDIEQSGTIIGIKANRMGEVCLKLENEYGFSGDYIGGETETVQRAKDCWID